MKRLLVYLFVSLFVIFIYLKTSSSAFAAACASPNWCNDVSCAFDGFCTAVGTCGRTFKCCKVCPTATPRPPTSTPSCGGLWQPCCSGRCNAGLYCSPIDGGTCMIIPTSTPIPPTSAPSPTAAPTAAPFCDGAHCLSAACSDYGGGCSYGNLNKRVGTEGCIGPLPDNAALYDICVVTDPNRTSQPCPGYYPGFSPSCLTNTTCSLNIDGCTTAPVPYPQCGAGTCGNYCGYNRVAVINCTQFEDIPPGNSAGYCGDQCAPDPLCAGIGACTPTSPPGGPTDTPGGPTNTPIPTNTPTPTPTPVPAIWIKLKNTSFVSNGFIVQPIPVSPVAYDADDDASANFITGVGGLVAAPIIDLISVNSSAKPSANDWSVAYTPSPYSLTASSFISYIKARKEYTEITSLDEIDKDGIYLYVGASPLEIASIPTSLDSYNAVISTASVVNVALGSFNPAKSVAILSPTINFSDTTTEAKGIFIADTVTTGTNTNQGLKIIGNLIAQTTLTNGREWTDVNKPAIFISFDQQKYLDLLPYLSITNYEWRQIQ